MSTPPKPRPVQPVYTLPVDTFGTRMRAAREQEKLSQLVVAAELGVTKGSLSAWENDKHFPQLETFVQLCRLYHASADALLFPAAVKGGGGMPVAEIAAGYLTLDDQQRSLLSAFAGMSGSRKAALLELIKT